MPCDFDTLLPHASALELGLEEEAAQKYCRLNADIIRDIHDPWKCPIEILPWLAYALSVDVWNDNWPEQTKRAMCANSLELHRHKGTHGGVEDALAVLGVRATIVYWHQMKPIGEEGTMSLTVLVNENILPDADVILGNEIIADIRQQIDSNKRASLHYTLNVGVETTAQFAIAHSAQFTTMMNVEMVNTEIAIKPQLMGFSMGLSTQFVTFMEMEMVV